MKNRQMRCLCVGLLLVVATAATAAPDSTVKECQALKDKIEHYTQLRRQGGSGAQMDSWKRARRASEKKFRSLGCSSYRWQLK